MANHWEQFSDGAPIYDEFGEVFGFEGLLFWNDKYKQYELNIDSVKNEIGIDLEIARGDRANARLFLTEVSTLIYAYIYKKKPAVLRNKTRYFLTYKLSIRRVLYEAMVDMIRYSYYSGGNIMAYQPGVNLNETGLIDIEQLRDERIVSYVTDAILKTNTLVDRNFIEAFEVPEEPW
jgi:hypothetical protein